MPDRLTIAALQRQLAAQDERLQRIEARLATFEQHIGGDVPRGWVPLKSAKTDIGYEALRRRCERNAQACARRKGANLYRSGRNFADPPLSRRCWLDVGSTTLATCGGRRLFSNSRSLQKCRYRFAYTKI
jgi:hypothetical protein